MSNEQIGFYALGNGTFMLWSTVYNLEMNNDMIELVPATHEDRFFIARVTRAAMPLFEPIQPGVFEPLAARIESDGLFKEYNSYVIRHSGDDVGFLGLAALTADITYMVALFFLPEFRGRGFGTEVLQTLEKNLSDRGVGELILLVHRLASWAIGFYQKNGYMVLAETEEAIAAYADGEMKKWLMPKFILMGKRLT